MMKLVLVLLSLCTNRCALGDGHLVSNRRVQFSSPGTGNSTVQCATCTRYNRTEITREDCVLPDYPLYGKWRVPNAKHLVPGQLVPPTTVVLYECDAGYILLLKNEVSICSKGKWSQSPECVAMCPSLKTTDTTVVSCEDGRIQTSCDEPYEGTTAWVQCKYPSPDNPAFFENELLECLNGTWDKKVPQCPKGNKTLPEYDPKLKNGCILPSYPRYGRWEVYGGKSDGRPGDVVQLATVLKYTCRLPFKIGPNSTYSACINGEWNVKPKCIRDSPEPLRNYTNVLVINIRAKRLIDSSNGCVLPSYPKNGKWTIYADSNNRAPGETAGPGKVLEYRCNDGFRLNPFGSHPICIDGKWTADPVCVKTCEPLKSTDTVTVACYDGRNEVSCGAPYAGVRAVATCNQYYEIRLGDLVMEKTELTCKEEGQWNDDLPFCEPVCGYRKYESKKPLIIGGEEVEQGEFPWQVAIYRDKVLDCGGSLIAPNVTITAAHCFPEPNKADEYVIAGGKYYRDFDNPNDTTVQFSKIKKLIINDKFNDGTPYVAFDIAIIIHQTPFKLTDNVLPVCFDRSETINEAILRRLKGIVTGWGFTKDISSPSEKLRMLEVDYQTEETCVLPTNFRKYYVPNAPDKLCAGLYERGKSACSGDSGSPLVFLGSFGRYYVRGLVSVTPSKPNKGCDEDKYTLYTAIHHHVKWILAYFPRNKPKRRDECVLPPFPKNGVWESPLFPQLTTHDIVKAHTVIEYRCDEGFKIQPSTIGSLSVCQRGNWVPKVSCAFAGSRPIDGCVLPKYPANGKYKLYGLAELQPGEVVERGALITYSCNSKYKLSTASQLSVCKNDGWTLDTKCISSSTSTPRGGCILPDYPQHGRWELYGNANLRSGDVVNSGSLINYKCNANHRLEPNYGLVVCTNGIWNTAPGCVPLVKKIVPAGGCTLPDYPENGRWTTYGQVEPGDPVDKGTVLNYECNRDYVLQPNFTLGICFNEKWSINPKCVAA